MVAHTYALPRPRRTVEITDIVAAATAALRDVATDDHALTLDEVARWCAIAGGVDPRLERAALAHALALISIDALVADVAAALRARLVAAGPLLPVLVATGSVPWVLALLGRDDVEPPPGAFARAVPPRVARFYWRRLRAFVAWSASTAWT